jgi:hypothetical protein
MLSALDCFKRYSLALGTKPGRISGVPKTIGFRDFGF